MYARRMSDLSYHLDEARKHLEKAARGANRFIIAFARVGFAANGVVYCLVGLLAALAPVGIAKTLPPASTRGALSTLLRQPVGMVLLGTIAAGAPASGESTPFAAEQTRENPKAQHSRPRAA